MRVTSIQLGRNDWTKQEAVDHVLGLLDKAPPSDLLILPEIWATGFFCFDRYQSEAEPVDGALVQTFKAKAAGLGCHILMGSFIEKNQNGLFNTCLLLDPSGSVIAKYSKIHLFVYNLVLHQYEHVKACLHPFLLLLFLPSPLLMTLSILQFFSILMFC